jgi:pre-mRNA-processing factor 19
LLELYDTRKALEETRRELSTALYQNDAAVRVIARVCAERDEFKSMGSVQQQQGEKRSRDEQQDSESVQQEPSKKKKVHGGIPPEDMEAMTTTWTALNAARKPIAKLKRTPDEIASIEEKFRNSFVEKKVNVHKSNSNGVLGLQCVHKNGEDYTVSLGKDSQIVVYNVSTGVISHSVSCSGVERVHAVAVPDGILICASTVNKEVKFYVLREGEEEMNLVSSMEAESEVVGIAIHPSSTVDAGRILVATAFDIMLVKSSGREMEILAKLADSAGNDVKYTAGELHPDGFIYAHGTEGGKLVIWDLKTQSLAMTLDVSRFDSTVYFHF